MVEAFGFLRTDLCFKAVLMLLALGLRPAMALAPCPSQSELLAKAKVVVEARVKSMSIGESGMLLTENYPTRMIRADLQIKKVIKGEFAGEEATVYGVLFPPGPFRELFEMAWLGGLGLNDTFEWELSRQELGDTGIAFYSMNQCIYYKFPDDVADSDTGHAARANDAPLSPIK